MEGFDKHQHGRCSGLLTGPARAANAAFGAAEFADFALHIERLLVQGEGLPVLKPSSDRLKTLLKAPALKDELKAREMFMACKQQLASKNPKEREAAKANLAIVAQKYPDTIYGKRATTLK